jgi:hypothetical protein
MMETIKNLGLSAGRILLLAFVAVCLLLVALGFLRVGLIYWIYVTVEDWAAVRLGFDYYISNLAATAFTALFSLLLPMLAWYLFLGKKQVWGIGATVGAQLLMCIAIYTVGSGVCFDRRSGKPLCYFADTPKGRVWSYTPGFEPTTGKPFRLYTREIKEAEDRRNSFSTPTPTPLPSRSVAPSAPAAARESISNTSPTPAPEKPDSVRREYVASRVESVRQTKETFIQPENSAAPQETFNRELELERIRQAEETRRQQILQRERLEAEQRLAREAENNRIRAERERLERERRATEQRAEREQREQEIARQREETRRREEKERQRRETVKTVVNIAEPIIERLTRRGN